MIISLLAHAYILQILNDSLSEDVLCNGQLIEYLTDGMKVGYKVKGNKVGTPEVGM